MLFNYQFERNSNIIHNYNSSEHFKECCIISESNNAIPITIMYYSDETKIVNDKMYVNEYLTILNLPPTFKCKFQIALTKTNFFEYGSSTFIDQLIKINHFIYVHHKLFNKAIKLQLFIAKQGDHIQHTTDFNIGKSVGNHKHADFQCITKTCDFIKENYIYIGGNLNNLELRSPIQYNNIYNYCLYLFNSNENINAKKYIEIKRKETGFCLIPIPSELNKAIKYAKKQEKIRLNYMKLNWQRNKVNLKENGWIQKLWKYLSIDIFKVTLISESHIYFKQGIVERQLNWIWPYMHTNSITILNQRIQNFKLSIGEINNLLDLKKYTMDHYHILLSWINILFFNLIPIEHYNCLVSLAKLILSSRLNFVYHNENDLENNKNFIIQNIQLRKNYRTTIKDLYGSLVTSFPKLFNECKIPYFRIQWGRLRCIDDAIEETNHLDSQFYGKKKNSIKYISEEVQIMLNIHLQTMFDDSDYYLISPILYFSKKEIDTQNISMLFYNNIDYKVNSLYYYYDINNYSEKIGKIQKISMKTDPLTELVYFSIDFLKISLTFIKEKCIFEFKESNPLITISIKHEYLDRKVTIFKENNIQYINPLIIKSI